MLTTFGNVALTCACGIGSHLSTIWYELCVTYYY